jgi:hypothetical protein
MTGLDWSSMRCVRSTEVPDAATQPAAGGGAPSSTTTQRARHPPARKLRVLGIGDGTGSTVDEANTLFCAHGEVVRIDMPRGKHYCFVEYAEQGGAKLALQSLHGTVVCGETLSVDYSHSTTGERPPDAKGAKIWVSGIPAATPKSRVEEIFAPFGRIARIDRPVGRSYLFVRFVRFEDAEQAIRALNNQKVVEGGAGGGVVRIKWSNPHTTTPAAAAASLHAAAPAAPAQQLGEAPGTAGAVRSARPPSSWAGVITRAAADFKASVTSFRASWTLFYDDSALAHESSVGERATGGPSMRCIGHFSDPSGFWEVTQKTPRVLPCGAVLLLLRTGVAPTTTGEAAGAAGATEGLRGSSSSGCGGGVGPGGGAHAGRFVVRVPRRESATLWYRLMNAALLEELRLSEYLRGIVLQPGASEVTLSLWTTQLDSREGNGGGGGEDMGVRAKVGLAEIRSVLGLGISGSGGSQVHLLAIAPAAPALITPPLSPPPSKLALLSDSSCRAEPLTRLRSCVYVLCAVGGRR